MPRDARRAPRAEKGATLLARLSVLIGDGDVNKRNYVYAGGSSDHRLDYFYNRHFRDADMPSPVTQCPCGVSIMEQCFVEHVPTRRLAVVGNCCIKMYIGSARTCVHCQAPHKNRLDSECNVCRTKPLDLTVPYSRKEEAKAFGARFDWTTHRWYALAHSKWCDRRSLSELFQPVALLDDDDALR